MPIDDDDSDCRGFDILWGPRDAREFCMLADNGPSVVRRSMVNGYNWWDHEKCWTVA